MIEGKTAVLFSAAAAAGMEITGGDTARVEAMRTYGMKLGMAFQIMDDALDYTASADDMGKNAGDDFADQKITLPTILPGRMVMMMSAPSGSARLATPISPMAILPPRRPVWPGMTRWAAPSPSPATSPTRPPPRWPRSWMIPAPRRLPQRWPTRRALPPPAAARTELPGSAAQHRRDLGGAVAGLAGPAAVQRLDRGGLPVTATHRTAKPGEPGKARSAEIERHRDQRMPTGEASSKGSTGPPSANVST